MVPTVTRAKRCSFSASYSVIPYGAKFSRITNLQIGLSQHFAEIIFVDHSLVTCIEVFFSLLLSLIVTNNSINVVISYDNDVSLTEGFEGADSRGNVRLLAVQSAYTSPPCLFAARIADDSTSLASSPWRSDSF